MIKPIDNKIILDFTIVGEIKMLENKMKILFLDMDGVVNKGRDNAEICVSQYCAIIFKLHIDIHIHASIGNYLIAVCSIIN